MNRSKGFTAIIVLIIVVLVIGIGAFAYFQSSPTSSPTERVDQASQQVDEINENIENRANQAAAVDNPAQILEYTDENYQEALESGKLVVLYFYSNWCPICRAEFPEMQSAFNKLDGDKVVGIRVNFNDSDTTDQEEAIAEEFDIPYQHSKVFLKDGEVVLKDLETWSSEERFITEINKHI